MTFITVIKYWLIFYFFFWYCLNLILRLSKEGCLTRMPFHPLVSSLNAFYEHAQNESETQIYMT